MSDPFVADVVSIVRFLEADGATTFADQTGKTWTAGGGTAETDSGSLLLDGSAFVQTDSSGADFTFGIGDFTIEWFAEKPTATAAFHFDLRKTNDNGNYPCVYDDAYGSLIYFCDSAAQITSAAGVVLTSTLQHFAYCRSGTTGRLFVDGVSVGSWSDSRDYDGFGQTECTLGAGNQSSNFPLPAGSRIYGFRATKAARYTANFTAPSPPFDSIVDAETLWPVAFDATEWGEHSIADTDQRIGGAGFIATVTGDDLAVTHWLQWIWLHGISDSSIGDLAVGESPRALSPPWWYSTIFGYPFVGEYLTVSPAGWMGQFGDSDVRSNLQHIRPASFMPSTPGVQAAYIDDRHIPIAGHVQTHWGHNAAVPMLRSVQQIDGTQVEHQGIGTAAITPMTISPGGLNSSVAADRVTVARSGQVINPDGLTGDIGVQWVTWEHRTLVLRGFEDFFCTEWHHARNAARVIGPATLDAGQFGVTLARNDLRFVQHNFPAGPQAFGSDWVAFAVRGVTITEGPPTPMPPGPVVQQWVQYVRPSGYMRAATDRHEVRGHQNVLSPDRTVPSTTYGIAGLVNEDREIRTAGKDAGPHGRATLLRDPEYLSLIGMDAALLGSAYVRDSLQTVHVGPSTRGDVPTTHWLRKELPDLPVDQQILDISADTAWVVANPVVRTNLVYPDGLSAARYGSVTVAINGVRPNGIPPPGYGMGGPVGVPSLANTQWIFGDGSTQFAQYGIPRMTPHYIFAPVGNGSGQYMDQWLYGPDPARPKFGFMEVTHDVRALVAEAFQAIAWGQHEAQSQYRTLNLVGPKLFKPGFPALRSGGNLRPAGLNATQWGDARVTPPTAQDDQTITAAGMFGSYGQHEVQNQHRWLELDGFEATLYGDQWASHQYDPFQIDSLLSLQAGEPLVEYLHRQVDVEGFDALDMTPYPGWSHDRMRVWPISFVAVWAGIAPGAVGTPLIERHHRTIGVGGIERPQIQVPEGGRVRGESQLAPSALDAGIIGGPRMWEPGDPLYPYAEDMLSLGSARMIGVVQATAFEALLMGDIRIAVPIEPAGDELTDWGNTVTAHDGGGRICNSYHALAIAMAAMDPSTIGSHGVAHDP